MTALLSNRLFKLPASNILKDIWASDYSASDNLTPRVKTDNLVQLTFDLLMKHREGCGGVFLNPWLSLSRRFQRKNVLTIFWLSLFLVLVPNYLFHWVGAKLSAYSLRAKLLDAKISWCQIVLSPSKLNLYITFLNLSYLIILQYAGFITHCMQYSILGWDLIEEVQLNSWIGQITQKLDWSTLEETSNLSLFMNICCVTKI